MKQVFITIAACFFAFTVWAQSGSAKQVKWNFTSKKIAENTYEVKMSADIGGNFHIYAQDAGADGPLPTTIKFNGNPLITLNGKVKEVGKLIKKREEIFDGDVNYYEKSVEFVQVVKLKGKVKTNLSGAVEFIACDSEKCLPPSTVEFKFNIGG